MMEYLARNLGDDVTGAYVHGSVGTYEETAYSDFDALVILSMDVFESPGRLIRVADRLRRAKTIMYEFDPLQHHGWFVLTEDDLSFHCEAHFPAALFRHCKSLIEDKGRRVSIASRDSRREIDDILKAVAGSVVDKLERGKQPENVYQLKCLTSEFMLLPALHVQRKTAAGEYKKYCFDEARRDFSPEVWQIMDEVSQLRLEWDYRLRPWQRRIATREHVLRDLYVRNQAPAIPGHMQARLTPDFYANMLRLAIQFRDRF
jgi:predicted nucleotidyltransferase